MTTERLEELVSLNRTRNQILNTLGDFDKNCWISIRTPEHEITVSGDNFRNYLKKLLIDISEEYGRIIDES